MGTEITVQVVERIGGQQYTITIPRPVALALGWRKGDVLDLSVLGNKVIIERILEPCKYCGKKDPHTGVKDMDGKTICQDCAMREFTK